VFDSTTCRPVLDPIQLPNQWVLDVISQEVKRPECQVTHSPPYCAVVRNEWRYAFMGLTGITLPLSKYSPSILQIVAPSELRT